MDYNELNLRAKKAVEEKAQSNAEAANRRHMLEEQETPKFMKYVIDFIEPEILEIANLTVQKKGEEVLRYIKVNKIIFGYPKTPSIKELYKSKWDEPIYNFLYHIQPQIQSYFQSRLSGFNLRISVVRFNGTFRADHRISVRMSCKNQ